MNEQTPTPAPAPEEEKKKPVLSRILNFIGFMGFIAPVVLTVAHLGFVDKRAHFNHPVEQFLSPAMLWLINAALGIVSGICFNPSKVIAAAVAGLAATMAMTGFTMFYLSWRESVYNYEFLIPLIIGTLAGLAVYNVMDKKSAGKKTS